jgi:hypothetical protein
LLPKEVEAKAPRHCLVWSRFAAASHFTGPTIETSAVPVILLPSAFRSVSVKLQDTSNESELHVVVLSARHVFGDHEVY